ncbi:MAG TPA: alpha/beta hydrolase [Thermoanaerobaculia bacterium]|nr:alpha/beta hydrolase [Thermoanaerobaculia bacterium]
MKPKLPFLNPQSPILNPVVPFLNPQSSILNPVEPPCRLVRFPAGDGVELAGLLFEPRRRTTRVAIFIHGMGGSFEPERSNIFARVFTAAGIAFFPFNNRGSYLVRRLGGGQAGMAHELIRDCVPDLDGAIRELRRRGYRDITLIGHSTGANKIAVYDSRKRRNFAKRYVLLAGGDDTGLMYGPLGPRRFAKALEKARAMIHARRGDELVPHSVTHLTMSWRSFYDMCNPNGDYNVFPFLEVLRGIRLSRRPRFRHVRAIRKPTLVLYGDRDESCYGDVPACVAALAAAIGPKPNFELAIMKDADHGFSGRQAEVAEIILRWMEAPPAR